MKSKRKNASKMKKWTWASLGALALFIGVWAIVITYAESKLSQLVLGGLGESFSTKVFSDNNVIEGGKSLSLDHVITRLNRLNYQQSLDTFLKPGEYHYKDDVLSIFLRSFRTPTYAQSERLVFLKLDANGKTEIRNPEGQPIIEFSLEPELIAILSGQQKVRRSPTKWEDFPPHLIQAVTAAEDHRFFHHWGIRPLAILRAFIHNIRFKGPLHGGSTITQQLAKNLFLTPKRTLRRKLVEAFLAFYLELRFSKKRILTLYLNHIYMGQDGFVSIAGMEAASQFYFGKSVKDLEVHESATLAGLIRSPRLYSPYKNPERSKKRRDHILRNMLKQDGLTGNALFDAQQAPIEVKRTNPSAQSKNSADYFVSEIVRELSPFYGDEALYRYGLNIYSTMDPLYQTWAQKAVQKTNYQAALVAIDPNSGKVQALVGGKNFTESQYNRATQAKRQPGSSFKAFVYGAALENGYSPTSYIQDELVAYPGHEAGVIWAPKNFDDVYRGTVTIRQALANSMNTATLDLVKKVGPSKIVNFARRLGITSPLEPTLALALGVYEVSLLEISAAYAPFANNGFRVKPYLISSVLDADGNLIELDPLEKKSVLDPALSYLMTNLLQSVIADGTGKRLVRLGWEPPTAGKTGTTNGGKDAWFIGYVPDLLAGVWVGDDEAKAIRVSGSGHALPIWHEFMAKRENGRAPLDFTQPDGLLKIKIDPESGQLAQSGCPQTIEELYLKGSEPTEKCSLHSGGIKGWFKKIFRKKS